VTIHPENPNTVFAGIAFGGLYRSDDGGLSWRPAASGLNPESAISDILFDPKNPAVIYAADLFSGVYRSGDNGETWIPINNGLRTRAVNKMAITSDGAHLYAGTEGEGVFRLDLEGQPPQPAEPVTPPPTDAPRVDVEPTPTQPPSPADTPSSSVSPTPEPAGNGIPCIGGLATPLLLAGIAVSMVKGRGRRRV